MKLMIDKYALTIPLFLHARLCAANKKLHNHGMMATPQTWSMDPGKCLDGMINQ